MSVLKIVFAQNVGQCIEDASGGTVHAKTWTRRVMKCAQQAPLSNDCGESSADCAHARNVEAYGRAGVFMLKIIFLFLTDGYPANYTQADMVVFREFLTYMLAATAIVVD